LTGLAYIAAIIALITVWIGARRANSSSYFTNAEVATVSEPRPFEAFGTPGVADASAVIDFEKLTRSRDQSRSGMINRRGQTRPMPSPRRGTSEIETAIPSTGTTMPELSAQSPNVAASFLALGDNNTTIPPDTQGTVGPNHLMVTLNSQVRIQTKNGAILSTVSMSTFWASMNVGEAFDPRIVYDPYANRWIFSAGADPQIASASILVGVSQTWDPTGKWNLYKIKADTGGTLWADFPTLGFNAKWIVVQANMFANAADSYSQSNIWALDKANLYAGGSGTYTRLQSTAGFTQYPAVTYDNTIATEYLLELWNGSIGQLRLSKITGSVGSEVLTTGIAFPATGAIW